MQHAKDKRYTYADYLKWGSAERWELIEGVPYLMAPAPSVAHQEISGALFSQLYTCLKGKPCKVFAAPFDVRLRAEEKDDTVVQPDITVVCDMKKIKNGQNCKGTPDMIMEILSPSSISHDQVVKFNAYRLAGVREYWVVNPEARNVQVFLLRDGNYISRAYSDTDTVSVDVLEGCAISLVEVFPRGDEASGAP